MKYKTHDSELKAVLDSLLGGVKESLADNLVGVYLQGSIATGGFDQDSDVDFIVVTREELTESQVLSLQSIHQRIFDIPIEWAKHLEGSYFPRELLRDITHCGSEVWYLEHGKSHLVRSNHCNTVVVRWIVRERPAILAGPDPTTLINPISTDPLRRSIYDDINDWGQEILDTPENFSNRFYQSFIVLNLCRMLRDLQVGEIGSKRLGTEWAKNHLDSSWTGLIDRAWGGRPNPAVSFRQPADESEFASTLRFVGVVMIQANSMANELGIR